MALQSTRGKKNIGMPDAVTSPLVPDDDSLALKQAVSLLMRQNGVLVLHFCRSRKANSKHFPEWCALELQALCLLGREAEAVRFARELLHKNDTVGSAWRCPPLVRCCFSVLANFLEPDEAASIAKTCLESFFNSVEASRWGEADTRDLLERVWLRGVLFGEALRFPGREQRRAWLERHLAVLEHAMSTSSAEGSDALTHALHQWVSKEALQSLAKRCMTSDAELDEQSTLERNELTSRTCAAEDETTLRYSTDERGQVLNAHVRAADESGAASWLPMGVSASLQRLRHRFQHDPAFVADFVTYTCAGIAALGWLIYAHRTRQRKRLQTPGTRIAARGSNRFWRSARDLLRSALFLGV
jgi:hypothetical protein